MVNNVPDVTAIPTRKKASPIYLILENVIETSMSRPEMLLLNARQAKLEHATSSPPKLGSLIQETAEFLLCAKVRIPQKGWSFMLSLHFTVGKCKLG